jgi:hypothetical protein
MSLTERVVVSEEGSEGFVDGGDELEREEAMDEHDSSQTMMKMRRGRHLQLGEAKSVLVSRAEGKRGGARWGLI